MKNEGYWRIQQKIEKKEGYSLEKNVRKSENES